MGAEEEEGQEEEKEEEEGQEEAEEEGRRALRHQDALRRPRRDLRQDQDVAPGDEEGPAGQLVEHVQDAGHAEEAHQVSARSRARSIAKPCPTLEQHMTRTTAAWQNLMTFRRCRVCTIFDPWT